jgi:hypothetical protein
MKCTTAYWRSFVFLSTMRWHLDGMKRIQWEQLGWNGFWLQHYSSVAFEKHNVAGLIDHGERASGAFR